MEVHTLNILVVFLVTIVAIALAAYPEGALHCYSSLTRPDNMLICPQGMLSLRSFLHFVWMFHRAPSVLYLALHFPHFSFIGRDVFCVKEVSSLKQDLCGKTQYFGDTYVGEECQFKKCSDQCVEGEYQFQYAGFTYTRIRHCCNDANYCNSAQSDSKGAFSFALIAVVSVVAILLAS